MELAHEPGRQHRRRVERRRAGIRGAARLRSAARVTTLALSPPSPGTGERTASVELRFPVENASTEPIQARLRVLLQRTPRSHSPTLNVLRPAQTRRSSLSLQLLGGSTRCRPTVAAGVVPEEAG